MGKSQIPIENRSFLKNTGLLLSARKNVFNNFKSKIFPTKNLDKIPTPLNQQKNKLKSFHLNCMKIL